MARQKREILEDAVHAVTEQAAKADDLVDEAIEVGHGRSDPLVTHAKMLRLELLTVKADLERELEDFSLNCSACGLDVHWVSGLGVSPGRWAHAEPAPHGEPAVWAVRRTERSVVLGCSWSMVIEPTSLSAGEQVPAASTFEDFFISEHERLFRALYMLTGNRDEADDLAQEALLRAYERWDRVGAMDSPAGYVYRTALNLYRNRLRGLVVRARRVFAAVPAEDLSGPLAASHDVRSAVAQLPRGQREALVLVDWLGLGSEEAGHVLGIDASSVRGRLHRAHATLRELLGGPDE